MISYLVLLEKYVQYVNSVTNIDIYKYHTVIMIDSDIKVA